MTLTEFWVEMHFDGPEGEQPDFAERLGTFPMRALDGTIAGTSRVLEVQYPTPYVVRMRVDVGDLAIPGLT